MARWAGASAASKPPSSSTTWVNGNHHKTREQRCIADFNLRVLFSSMIPCRRTFWNLRQSRSVTDPPILWAIARCLVRNARFEQFFRWALYHAKSMQAGMFGGCCSSVTGCGRRGWGRVAASTCREPWCGPACGFPSSIGLALLELGWDSTCLSESVSKLQQVAKQVAARSKDRRCKALGAAHKCCPLW